MKELRPESDKALKIIADFWAKEDPKWVVTRDNVYRYLIEHEEVATGDIEEHRLWYIHQVIFKVGNHYIRASIAKTTTDFSAIESGWDFDPNSMAEVFPVKRWVTQYITEAELDGR